MTTRLVEHIVRELVENKLLFVHLKPRLNMSEQVHPCFLAIFVAEKF